MSDPITIDPVPIDSALLSTTAGLGGDPSVPHLSQWFGWWHYEPQRAAALYDQLRKMDVLAHVRGWKQGPADDEDKRQRSRWTGEKLPDAPGYQNDNGIAVISLSGSLMKHLSSVDDGTSTVMTRRLIRACAVDPEILAVIIVVDSPGGTVSGAYDLADDIKYLASKKPTFGYASDLACSAGYLQLAMTRSISANRTALVGCIGTFGVMYDYSEMFKQDGVRPIVISSGGFKGAGVPGTAITPEQVSEWQREIDQLNAAFIDAVAAGRKMPRDKATILADGRTWVAADAKKHGLIDRVESLDELVARVRREIAPQQQKKPAPVPDGGSDAGGPDAKSETPDPARAAADSPEPPATPPAPIQEGDMPDPVKEPAANEPKPATVKELKQEFADDPAFALEAAENGWTMDQANGEYGKRLRKQQAEQKAADKAKAEKERAETPPAGGKGNKAVSSGRAAKQSADDDGEGDSGDPVADYNAAIEKQMAKPGFNGDRKQAVAIVNKRDPELHRSYLEATNTSRKARDLIADKFEDRKAAR